MLVMYISTFFYNHEKHMKGYNEKDKYKNFIRTQSKNKFEQRISDYSKKESILKKIKPLQSHQDSLKTSF